MRHLLLLGAALVGACAPPPVATDPPPVTVDDGVTVAWVGAGVLEPGVVHGHVAHLVGAVVQGEALPLGAIAVDHTGTGRAEVTLSGWLEGFSEPVVRQGFAEPGARTTFALAAPLDVDAVLALTAPARATFTAGLRVRGEVRPDVSVDVTITPVDEVPWRAGDADVRGLVVTLVTPDTDEVARLLRHAEGFTPDAGIGGYEQGDTAVLEDVRAVWEAATDLGAAFAPLPPGFFDAPRRVRPPPRAVVADDATSLDGALLLASAFEAMGLEASLALLPDAALVALRSSPGGALYALEPSRLGVDDFLTAAGAGADAFDAAVDDPAFLFVSLDEARAAGLTPVPL